MLIERLKLIQNKFNSPVCWASKVWDVLVKNNVDEKILKEFKECDSWECVLYLINNYEVPDV